jgi:hypothetical protein
MNVYVLYLFKYVDLRNGTYCNYSYLAKNKYFKHIFLIFSFKTIDHKKLINLIKIIIYILNNFTF